MAFIKQSAAIAAAKQAEAIRRAAEEAERRRRRAAIEAQIRQWEEKLRNVESQIAALTDEKSKLGTCLTDWSTQKSICSSSDILSEVVVLNVFEGVCADQIRTDMGTCLAKMDKTCSNVFRLNGSIAAQISRLQQYVSVIQTKLSSLRSELNSI